MANRIKTNRSQDPLSHALINALTDYAESNLKTEEKEKPRASKSVSKEYLNNKYGLPDDEMKRIVLQAQTMKRIEQNARILKEKKETVFQDLKAFKFPTLPAPQKLHRNTSEQAVPMDFVDSIYSSKQSTVSQSRRGGMAHIKKALSRQQLTSLKIQQNIQLFNTPSLDRSFVN